MADGEYSDNWLITDTAVIQALRDDGFTCVPLAQRDFSIEQRPDARREAYLQDLSAQQRKAFKEVLRSDPDWFSSNCPIRPNGSFQLSDGRVLIAIGGVLFLEASKHSRE